MGKKTRQVVNPEYTPQPYKPEGYETFEDFYPFYLGEHCDQTNRRLHLVGTTFSLMFLALSVVNVNPNWVLLALVQGYGLAWTGHFFFEKNQPATFKHPLYSLMGDFRLWWEVISGAREF